MRLGFGEVEPVNRKDAAKVARQAFLLSIQNNAPKILDDLSRQPLDVLLATNNHTAVKETLRTWSCERNLEADWFIEAAYDTLVLWAAFKEHIRTPSKRFRIKYRVWSPPIGSELWHPSVDMKPPCRLVAWHAELNPLNTYLAYSRKKLKDYIKQDAIFVALSPQTQKSVLKDLMLKVNEYCDRVLKAYLSQKDDTGEYLWRRSDTKAELARNLKWTVMFQIHERTFSQIAKLHKVEVSTVSREIDNVLNTIGLKRRDVPRGRTKGAKESPDSRRQSMKRAGITD